MSEFIEFLREQFAEFGEVQSKRMFGGHGIYYHELMIGLVADDTLYLKIDGETEALFLAAGSQPFMYNKAGKLVKMSYYEAPAETLEDPDEMKHWAKLAWDAACRSKK